MKLYQELFLLLIVVVCLSGCSDDNGSSSQPSFSGNWVGTTQSSFSGAGTFQISMTQSGTNVTGTYQVTFGSASTGGSLSGSASGNSLSAVLRPSNPNEDCPYNLNANMSGSTLSGTYAAFDCTVAVTGTFTATRQ